MNVLFVIAVALLLRVLVRYFGVLSSSTPGEAILTLTAPLVVPFGIHSVRSLYGGVFEINATVTMVLVLLGEWFMSMLRRDG